MAESPVIDAHKAKALELATVAGGQPDDVVKRANAYHAFLTGGAAPKPAAAKPAAAPAAGTKPAETKPAAAPKATPAAGTKPAAPKAATPGKPAAAAPKTGAAAGGEPAGDTKDPKGNNTFDDVKKALQAVMRSVKGDDDKHTKGRALAYELLAAKGGGVKGVRDLKPAFYDAVVAACEEAVKPKKAAAAAAPAAQPSGDFEEDAPAGVEADETDPPEETGGGLPAESSGEDV
jgi:hypothetical protein